MQNVQDIIKAFGGPTKFGHACGFAANPAARGSDMRQRGSIPVAYWQRLIEVAPDYGVKGLTYEVLAKANTESRIEHSRAVTTQAEDAA